MIMENNKVMACPNCGHAISASSRFCPFCGVQVFHDSMQDQIEAVYDNMATAKARNFRKAQPWFVVGSVICLIVGLVVVFAIDADSVFGIGLIIAGALYLVKAVGW